MPPDKTAWELVSGGDNVITVGHVEMPSRAYIAAFGFKGAAQQKPVRLFSGGERDRLNLALTRKQGGNVLLPDEPTTTWTPKRSPRSRTRCWIFPAASS